MTDNQHTPWSPSTSERRILCPGSLHAEAKHKDTDNLPAVIGSGAHALGETVLKQSDLTNLEFLVEDYLDEEMFVPMSHDRKTPVKFDDKQVRTVEGGYMVTVDHEMVGHITEYVAHCKAYIMDKDFTGVYGVEEKLSLDKVLPGNSGTADWNAIVGNTLHVDDLKYGKGVQVFAKGNTQGRCYAVGVFLKLSKEDKNKIKDIAITIYQPRLGHIDTEMMDINVLKTWAKEVLVPAYKLSQQPDAPRIPGTKQCTFCKHRHLCVELKAMVEHQMSESFPITTKDHKELPAIIPLQVAKLATIWAKAVEAHAIDRLEAGEVVDDGEQKYKLVHGRGSRDWNDKDQAQKICRMNKIYSKDFMSQPSFKTAPQIEKLVGKKKFTSLFSKLVDKKLGKPTIAPESDKREAINSAEALGFNDVSKK